MQNNKPELFTLKTNAQGATCVSARELHEFLEVKTDFTDWSKRMFEYGFEEGVDYSLLKIGERSAHNKVDYALTLDTAKEISMLQKSEKGKQARQYFIACEKRSKTPDALTTEQFLARALLLSNDVLAEKEVQLLQATQAIEDQQHVISLQSKELEIQAPKTEFFDRVMQSKSVYNITLIAKEFGMSAIELNNKLQQMKVHYKQQGVYVLTAKYQDKGYTATKTHVFKNSMGDERTTILTVWTEKGRNFLHSLFNPNLNTNISLS